MRAVVTVLFSALSFAVSGGQSTTASEDYVPGELLVMTREAVAEQRLAEMNSSCGTQTDRKVATFGTKEIYLLKIVDDRPVEAAIDCWSQFPEIEVAEPNYRVRVQPK